MPNDKQDQARIQKFSRSADKQIDMLNDRLDNMYKDLYTTDIEDKEQLDRLTTSISQSVNSILSSNSDIDGMPDISRLYSRIQKRNSAVGIEKKITDGLMDVMSNEGLMTALMADPEINRYIKAKDLQTDMILKYMPKLKEALAIKMDNVLSADNFNKSFLNPINDALVDEDDQVEFSKNARRLIKKYDLETKLEKVYDNTAKYGEEFLYIVPYKKALMRLKQYDNRGDGSIVYDAGLFESTSIIEKGKIPIGDKDGKNILNENKELAAEIEKLGSKVNVSVTYNNSGLLEEVIQNYAKAEEAIAKSNSSSLYESYLTEAGGNEFAINNLTNTGAPVSTNGTRTSSFKSAERISMDKTLPDDLEYDKLLDLYIKKYY